MLQDIAVDVMKGAHRAEIYGEIVTGRREVGVSPVLRTALSAEKQCFEQTVGARSGTKSGTTHRIQGKAPLDCIGTREIPLIGNRSDATSHVVLSTLFRSVITLQSYPFARTSQFLNRLPFVKVRAIRTAQLSGKGC